MHTHIYSIKNWIARHERKLSALSLLTGFIIDALTLRRIDNLFENLVFVTYCLLVALSVIAINYIEAGKYEREWVGRIHPFLLLLIQFAFGGLFSGFSIFYFRSGSLLSSWPFIMILAALLIGNDSLRKQYERLVLQVTLLFVALFFFTIFALPVVLNRMGPFEFILSGVVALILITGFVYLLHRLVPDRVARSKRILIYTITSVYVIINVLYFTNLIPPIPLSLKDVGVYHYVESVGSSYIVKRERPTFLSKLELFEDIHITKGQPLYVYSAIFAPNKINTSVVHNWRYFDEGIGRWVSVSRIPYNVVGGTDSGFRGYTTKSSLAEGRWAVRIETDRGQVIGRIAFDVVYEEAAPELVEKVL